MAGKTFDIARLAAAAKKPGIDPRINVTFAVVEDVAYDPNFGMFADVQFQPDGQRSTAYVGSDYAGNGWGRWNPLRAGDLVLVVLPSGDPASGCVLLSRVWTATARPPAEFQNPDSSDDMDPSDDPVVVVEPGRTLRVIARDGASVEVNVSGSGKAVINATGEATIEAHAESAIILDSPDVRVGTGAGAAIARVGDLVALSVPLPSPVTPTTVVGQIVSGASAAKA